MAAPFVAESDFLESRACCYSGNQISLNVRRWVVQDLVGLVQLDTIAAKLDNDLSTLYKNAMCSLSSWRGVGVRVIDPTPTVEWAAVANDGVGNLGGNILPLQTSGVVTLRSNTPGPSGRGRFYVGFPAVVDATALGTPGAGYQGVLAVLGDYYASPVTIDDGGGNSCELAPVLVNLVTPTVRFIQTYTVRKEFGTQRRRGGFGAGNVLPF